MREDTGCDRSRMEEMPKAEETHQSLRLFTELADEFGLKPAELWRHMRRSAIAAPKAIIRKRKDRWYEPEAMRTWWHACQERGTVTDEPAVRSGAARLLDLLKRMLELENDIALAGVLGVAPPAISHIRHGRQVVSASMLLRMHELSGLSIGQMKSMLPDKQSA